MSEPTFSPELQSAIEVATLDIAIAGNKLDELAVIKGGPEFARYARKEVQRRENYRNMSTIEAIQEVYRLISGDKLN